MTHRFTYATLSLTMKSLLIIASLLATTALTAPAHAQTSSPSLQIIKKDYAGACRSLEVIKKVDLKGLILIAPLPPPDCREFMKWDQVKVENRDVTARMSCVRMVMRDKGSVLEPGPCYWVHDNYFQYVVAHATRDGVVDAGAISCRPLDVAKKYMNTHWERLGDEAAYAAFLNPFTGYGADCLPFSKPTRVKITDHDTTLRMSCIQPANDDGPCFWVGDQWFR